MVIARHLGMAQVAQSAVPTEAQTLDQEEVSYVRRRDLLGVPVLDPKTRLDSAVALHLIGDHQQALQQLEPLTLQLDATAAEALWISALCHVARGEETAAVGCLEVALLEISIDRLSRLALLYELGVISQSLGDLRRARAAFREVHDHAPSFRDTAARAYALGA
jgi:tetratricopeptide (TPR) repeat protein